MPPKRRSARAAASESEASRKKAKTGTATSPPESSPPHSLNPTSKAPSLSSSSSSAGENVKSSSHPGPKEPEPHAIPPARFTSYEVPSKSKPIQCERSHAPSSPPISLIFTHGAGGGLTAAAMTNFSHGFASAGAAITCFQGSMNLQGRTSMFANVLDYEKQQLQLQQPGDGGGLEVAKLAFGGRSMGARAAVMASHADDSIHLLVLVSYPLVAPSGDVRDQILLDVRPETNVLFISGDGDSMCDLARLAKVRAKMKAKTWLVVVQGADHGMSLKGGAKMKKATEEIGKETGRIAARWIQQRDEKTTEMVIRWDGDHGRVLGQWNDDQAVREGKATTEPGGIAKYFAKAADKDEAERAGQPARRKRK